MANILSSPLGAIADQILIADLTTFEFTGGVSCADECLTYLKNFADLNFPSPKLTSKELIHHDFCNASHRGRMLVQPPDIRFCEAPLSVTAINEVLLASEIGNSVAAESGKVPNIRQNVMKPTSVNFFDTGEAYLAVWTVLKPVGHFGLIPVTFLVTLPLTHEMTFLIAAGLTAATVGVGVGVGFTSEVDVPERTTRIVGLE
jgi:hypothetical protein